MSDQYRYGPYRDGPDPLAPPYDVRTALDELANDVLAGSDVDRALRDLHHRGTQGRRGLADMLRQVRQRQRQLRRSGNLDATLEQVRALLEEAVAHERAELSPDSSDDARIRQMELDDLPEDTARATRQLADYQWRSDAARATFQRLQDLLRREVLDSQFRGMKQALQAAQKRQAASEPGHGGDDPEAQQWQHVEAMLADLNALLDADARGEHTQRDFERFMTEHGDFFPDNPGDLDELVDQLARRAAAGQRLLQSLSPQQREELGDLMRQVLSSASPADLAGQLGRLSDALRARRPDLDWESSASVGGPQPLGMGDATTALAELSDLEQLETELRQDYPGARLEDVDEDAVRRALGRNAASDLDDLRRIEQELERQGYFRSTGKRATPLELTPKALRRLGETALRRIFAELEVGKRGEHQLHDAGPSAQHEPTGASRPWQFGDEQPLDAIRTVGNAVRRASATETARRSRKTDPIRLTVDDFEVVETERHTSTAISLLVDLSYSMTLREAWGAAKQTALAVHHLVTTRYPADAVQIVGFSNYARVLTPMELATVEPDMVQGTNLHHALRLAGRHLDRHPQSDPLVMIVTDGEPTAHLTPGGGWWFNWPPDRETIELTLAEVDRMTRRRATLNVFQLADDEQLEAFVHEVTRRNGGRMFSPSPERLGEYVVSDLFQRRRSHERSRK